MKSIILYGSGDEWIVPMLREAGEFRLRITDKPDFASAADAVLISQQFAGAGLEYAFDQAQQYRLPAAAVCFDNSVQNQAYLTGLGAEDVLAPPMTGKIAAHRVRALTDRPVHSDAQMNFAAFDRIMESNQGQGAFIVAEHDFMNIYRFVSRLLERLDQRAQLILFGFSSEDGNVLDSEPLLHFMKVVQTSLRRGDITSVCGDQVLVILTGADEAGAQTVIARVVGTFNAHYNMDESCEVTWETREISRASGFRAGN